MVIWKFIVRINIILTNSKCLNNNMIMIMIHDNYVKKSTQRRSQCNEYRRHEASFEKQKET